jgi:putative acid phosphatase of HAD superfamily subfamily IIIB
VVATGCAVTEHPSPVATTPVPSLAEAKRQVTEYVASGRYETEIAAVAEHAIASLERRAARGGKLAIVVDIDETALSNLPDLRANEYGFIVAGPCDLQRGPCGFVAWAQMAQAEAIKPVLALAHRALELASPCSSSPAARNGAARRPRRTSAPPATSGRRCC